MKAFAAAAVVALVLAGRAAAEQPNLLFVLTDDQRADAIEVMPKTAAAFPVEFTRFFVSTPNCCPSRSTYLTGRHIHATGVHTSTRAGYEAFQLLEPESLGPWLQQLGYRTGFVGKYFNQYLRTDSVPPGWDEFYGRVYGEDRGNGSSVFALREFAGRVDDAVVSYPNADWPEPYATRVFGEKAEEFVRRSVDQGRPFALFLWTIGVNTAEPEPVYADAELPPWLPPPSFLEPDMSDKPSLIRRTGKRELDPAVHESVRASQLRQALTIDDVVGDLVGALDELGVRGSTFGVFASDNGRLWGEHRLGGKVWPYEEAIRVPFRLMVPGAVEMRIPAIAGNVDVAPTLLALAGDTASRSFDGRSLLPLLAEPAAPWRKRLLLESYKPGYCGIRGTHWKYVRYASGEEELYRMGRDRFELRSLHLSKTRVLKQMRARVFRSACQPPGW